MMEKYLKSIEELQEYLDKNEYLTQEEWDLYAQKNGYFSSTTIRAHLDVYTWEDIKNKLTIELREEKINRKIEKVRKKLYESIEENGINSQKTIETEKKFDILINLYYKSNKHKAKGRYYKEEDKVGKEYQTSYEYLKSLTNKLGEFPDVSTWNKFATKKGCLSSTSIQYISGMNWHKLRDKIKTDINFNGFKII